MNIGYEIAAYYTEFYRGKKLFELTNHLGNVMATVTDTKIPVAVAGNITYFKANVISACEYAPFGMQLPGRTISASSYRYGFNGKEMDNETYGQGNVYDYGFRIYNPRIGKFLSVDPLTSQYPFYTPYQFASNTPISAIDLDGLESKIVVIATSKASPELQINKANIVPIRESQKQAIVDNLSKAMGPQIKQTVSNSTLGSIMKGRLFTLNEDDVIEKTVSAYLNFSETTNYIDQHSYNGQSNTILQTSADFNYDELGGEEFVNDIAGRWEIAKDINDKYGTFKDITGYKDPGDLLKEKIEEAAGKAIEKQVIKWGNAQTFQQLANITGKIGKYGNIILDVLQNLQGELSNDGPSAVMPIYIEEIEKATINAMLKYFIQDGSKLPNGINVNENNDKPKVDNTNYEMPLSPEEHNYE